MTSFIKTLYFELSSHKTTEGPEEATPMNGLEAKMNTLTQSQVMRKMVKYE